MTREPGDLPAHGPTQSRRGVPPDRRHDHAPSSRPTAHPQTRPKPVERSRPLAGLTARQALATLPEGGSLLVTGASGAVGGFAVQLAAQAGAEVYAVASAGDEEWVAGLGAAHVLGREPVEL